MPWRQALRDLVILLATLALWSAERALADGGGAPYVASAIAAGLLTAVCGFLVHEWGHLCAARLVGARLELPDSVASLFLFRFDVDHNDPRHFVAMSCGGFLATAVVAALLLTGLPGGSVATWIAWSLTALGVVATVVSELPPFFRVLGGGPLPRGAAYASADD